MGERFRRVWSRTAGKESDTLPTGNDTKASSKGGVKFLCAGAAASGDGSLERARSLAVGRSARLRGSGHGGDEVGSRTHARNKRQRT